jgi:curved DNA-binding protein CbpA
MSELDLSLDAYKVLQVDSEADPDVIQAAFRRLVMKYHPDVAPGPEAAAKMKTINAAWGILRDPEMRAAYDQLRARRSSLSRSPYARPVHSPHSPTGHAPTTTPTTAPRTASGPHRDAGEGDGASAAATVTSAGSAGPPPGNPSGTVLNFGRYSGWSLGEIARADLEYIEWLDRAPIGRNYRAELDEILRRTGSRGAGPAETPKGKGGLFRRR